LYSLYWIYTTWRELKDERRDANMHPVWHALAMVVPVLGWVLFYRHIQMIRGCAASYRLKTSLRPGIAVAIWILAVLIGWGPVSLTPVGNGNFELFVGPSVGFEFGVKGIGAAVLIAAVLVWAQANLNRVWQALPDPGPWSRIHPAEWIVLALGVLIWGLAVLSLIASG
jgi:hypothetical protein